jgi:hypothetical protein
MRVTGSPPVLGVEFESETRGVTDDLPPRI